MFNISILLLIIGMAMSGLLFVKGDVRKLREDLVGQQSDINTFEDRCFAFGREETGATAIEYGLIAALIAVVIIAALLLLGTAISSKFDTIANSVSTAGD